MTEQAKTRKTASAIGVVHSLETDQAYAFLYRWNNGDLQLGPMDAEGTLIAESGISDVKPVRCEKD